MPRMAAVSGRSITWFSRVNPRPLTTFFCFTGVQIVDRTHFNWILPLAPISMSWSSFQSCRFVQTDETILL